MALWIVGSRASEYRTLSASFPFKNPVIKKSILNRYGNDPELYLKRAKYEIKGLGLTIDEDGNIVWHITMGDYIPEWERTHKKKRK